MMMDGMINNMNKETTKEFNNLAASCWSIYEDERAGMEWRMAHLILARDVAGLTVKYAEPGAAKSYAVDLEARCSRTLELEYKNTETPKVVEL